MKITKADHFHALYLCHHRAYKLRKESCLPGWSERDVLTYGAGAHRCNEPVTDILYREFLHILGKHFILPKTENDSASLRPDS